MPTDGAANGVLDSNKPTSSVEHQQLSHRPSPQTGPAASTHSTINHMQVFILRVPHRPRPLPWGIQMTSQDGSFTWSPTFACSPSNTMAAPRRHLHYCVGSWWRSSCGASCSGDPPQIQRNRSIVHSWRHVITSPRGRECHQV